MAASMAAAFDEVDRAALDVVVHPARRPEPAPTDAEEEATLKGHEGTIRRIQRELAGRLGTSLGDAEEATQDAFEKLLLNERQLLREDTDSWRAWVYKTAYYRLLDIRSDPQRFESIEALRERAGDAILGNARPCVPPSVVAEEDCRDVPAPRRGRKWARRQIIGALQRFGDRKRRPPKGSECLSMHRLPSLTAIGRHFGSFGDAIIAAGMVPSRLERRRRPQRPVESARSCLAFRRRNWRWPDSADARREPVELPSDATMIRNFGGTRSAQVQQGAESILAAVEAA